MKLLMKLLLMVICINITLTCFELKSQGLYNLDKVTGYKNFKFGLSKEQFKNYKLVKFDESNIGFVKEYGTTQYAIQNYNGKLGEFSISEIILHFISNKLAKITLDVDGNVEEVHKFLIYQFGVPNIKNFFKEDPFKDPAYISNGGEVDAIWEGELINLVHKTQFYYTIPPYTEHKIVFSLVNYDKLNKDQKTKIYDQASKDFFDSKPKENTINQENSVKHNSPFKFGFDIGERIEVIPSNYKLLGISSKDNSKIYRWETNFPTTVFSYKVDKYEIKVWNNTVVSFHLVLNPLDNLTGIVPVDLLNQIKAKSGTSYSQVGDKYYFDQDISQIMVSRNVSEQYSGDRIHVFVISNEYLKK